MELIESVSCYNYVSYITSVTKTKKVNKKASVITPRLQGQQSSLLRIPDELLLLILKDLPLHSRVVLGLTCRKLFWTILPINLCHLQLKQPGKGFPFLTYLHLLARDIPNGWVCYYCHCVHSNLLHPSFCSSKYNHNLKQWAKHIPPLPPLPSNLLIPAPPTYGSPTCIPFEISAYTSLLPRRQARDVTTSAFVAYKSEHSLPTPIGNIRQFLRLHLTRLPDHTILSHTRHTFRFHPRGVRIMSVMNIYRQALALRLSVCAHIRLSADPADEGNLLLGMLSCAIHSKKLTRHPDHDNCARNRRENPASDHGGEASRRALGRTTHWVKCEECGAECCVWFDPRGEINGRMGSAVCRVDVWKELGVVRTTEKQEQTWERQVGRVEQMWKDRGRDFWESLDGDRELKALDCI